MLMTVLSGMKSWCHKMWYQVGMVQVKMQKKIYKTVIDGILNNDKLNI